MSLKHKIALALFLLTCACFAHVCMCDFITFDDPMFVTDNEHVQGGLTAANVRWAFSASSGWAFMVWLSLQLDATLFGANAAWGFHLTNLLLHAVSVVMFFYILEQMTHELWPSTVCAALFAVHPLRVESVAWIAERRDVLSMVFLLATLAAYHYYAKQPGWLRYLLVLVIYGVGLSAKPTAVTLPFALVLLDYWPLHRLHLGQAAPATAGRTASSSAVSVQPLRPLGELPAASWPMLILEKVPMLAIAVAVSLLSLMHLREIEASREKWLTLPEQLSVSIVGYLTYLGMTFWPTNLAALYPVRVPPVWLVAVAICVLSAITAAFFLQRRRLPMLLVGWLWFLGTLVPVIGIVGMGKQGVADRYTHMPHLGLFITIVWGVAALPAWRQATPTVRKLVIGAVLMGLGLLTWFQVWSWTDSERFYADSLSVTKNNYTFHAGLSALLEKRGAYDKAEFHIRKALEDMPDDALYLLAYGSLLVHHGNDLDAESLHQEAMVKYQEAVAPLTSAAERDPKNPDVHCVLAMALDKLKRPEEAAQHFEKALEFWEARRRPDVTRKENKEAALQTRNRQIRTHLYLGDHALREGKPAEGLDHIDHALGLQPNLMAGYRYRGIALGRLKRWQEAESAFDAAAELGPQDAASQGYLAFAYARQNKPDKAAQAYSRLLTQFPDWLARTSDFAVKSVTILSLRNPKMAEELALQICEATQYRDPRGLDTLAVVQAANNDFPTAQATARKALDLATDPALKKQIEERLHIYEKNRALPVLDDKQHATIP